MFDCEVTLHSLPTMHHHTPLVWRFCHMHCVVPISQVAPEGLQLKHLQRGEETWSQTRLNKGQLPVAASALTCLSFVPVAGSAHQCSMKVATGLGGRMRASLNASSSSNWSSTSSLCKETRCSPSNVKPKRAWLHKRSK